MNRLSFFILPCILLCYSIADAQGIKIMPGTTFKLVGGTLDVVCAGATHFENNAIVQSNNLILKATGNGSSEIKGSGALSVRQILVNKSAGQSLLLLKNVNVAGDVTFSTGLLDLNGSSILLADTALLLNESETSRIVGAAGGSVQIQNTLDAPLAENPGNLGLIITSGANWGSTIIRRSHNTFTNPGGGSSIARSYYVQPANNTGLNAFLRMYYRDAELNGLDENAFDFYHSTDGGVLWTDIGAVSRNTTQNFVNINGIQSLSLLTLSPLNNPLPLLLNDMVASCDHNKARLQWRTTSPQSTSFFSVMKSNDGAVWEMAADRIGVIPQPDYLYTFTDAKSPAPFYRLESLGLDGAVAYSPVLKVNCSEESLAFNLLQNPIENTLQIGVTSKNNHEAALQIFDLQGRLMIARSIKISPGVAKVNIDAGRLAAGIYNLRINSPQELFWQVKFVKR
ncbi:MAG: T9SS type A sorting domain-containing protein [Taibaiella sp.]|jgi:hypothetical protein